MFRKSEKKPLYQSYFKLLADRANYAEVKSKCVGDIWMLKVEDGFIVTYHKPRGQKKYHYQERSVNIESAVKKIRKHDDYVRRYRRARPNSSRPTRATR